MKMKKILGAVATLSMICMTVSTAFAATPVYENNFDGSLNGAHVITREGDNENGGNPGTLPVVNDSVAAQFAEGVNGKALSLDGNYGVVVDTGAVGDSYSISFWINPARFSTFGPLLQVGSDLLSAKVSATWLNITKAGADWGEEGAPLIWSRNEAIGAWPWYNKAGGYQLPKNEWSHVVVTVDGATPVEEANCYASKLYVNGELIAEGGVAGGIFTPADTKLYIGMNCWDINAKAMYDDLKLYNVALTQEEVTEAMNSAAGAVAAETTAAASTDVPKTGVASSALILGLGAAVLGTGSVVLKKKEK